MAQTLDQVLDGASSIIADITPDYRPRVAFVEADYREDLAELPVSSHRSSRLFQVVAGVVEGFGGPQGGSAWNGPLEHHLPDIIVVKVRYYVPRTQDARAVLSRMAGTDAQRIYHDLAYATSADWGGDEGAPSRVETLGTASVDPIDEEGEGWVLTLPLEVDIFLGSN